MKATLMMRIEAAKSLHDYDHAFVSAEGVRKFGRIFGVVLTPTIHRANPGDIKGLTLDDGATEAEGMCAAQMARRICDALGVHYPQKFGRGSQLHAAADALTKHYEAQLSAVVTP